LKNHSKTPIVNNRFSKSDPVYLKRKVFEIIQLSTNWVGKHIVTTQTVINMDFKAVIDDILNQLTINNFER